MLKFPFFLKAERRIYYTREGKKRHLHPNWIFQVWNALFREKPYIPILWIISTSFLDTHRYTTFLIYFYWLTVTMYHALSSHPACELLFFTATYLFFIIILRNLSLDTKHLKLDRETYFENFEDRIPLVEIYNLIKEYKLCAFSVIILFLFMATVKDLDGRVPSCWL